MNALERMLRKKIWTSTGSKDEVGLSLVTEKDIRKALLDHADELITNKSKYIEEANLIAGVDTVARNNHFFILTGRALECGRMASEIKRLVGK